MSEHPDPVIEMLRDYANGTGHEAPRRSQVAHFLALFDHHEAQLTALRKLKTPAPLPTVAVATDETVCQEADRIVSSDRQQAYGHPREDMTRTAAMWEAILGVQPGWIAPEKVATTFPA